MAITQLAMFDEAQPRRAMSRRMIDDATRRLAQLEAYRLEHENYDVPREGEHADLGDWLDKLRETYAKRPDGHRVRWVARCAPALHSYLIQWSATRRTRRPDSNIPFWISACWSLEFMQSRLVAPSQASVDPHEISLARWLSRWSNDSACALLRNHAFRHTAATELFAIAELLRAAPANARAATELMFDAAYRTLGALADEEAVGAPQGPWSLDRHALAQAISLNQPFWPTWQQFTSTATAGESETQATGAACQCTQRSLITAPRRGQPTPCVPSSDSPKTPLPTISWPHAHPDDEPLARGLLAAGVPARTVSHALQLPLELATTWLSTTPPSKQKLRPHRAYFGGDGGTVLFATSVSNANTILCGGRAPDSEWRGEFGCEPDPDLDHLWSLQPHLTPASSFLIGRSSTCPVCDRHLERTRERAPDDPAETARAQPVGAQVKGYAWTRNSDRRLTDMGAIDLMWGVDELVCAGECWQRYLGRLDDRLRRRRDRLRAALQPKHVEPSMLENFCKSRGIDHRRLWVLIQAPGRAPHDRRYFRVESLDGAVATVSIPLGQNQKRRYGVPLMTVDDAMTAGRFCHSTTRPPSEPELDVLCRRLKVASQTVRIEIDGAVYVPAFAIDGIVTLLSGRKPQQKSIQLDVATFEKSIRSPETIGFPAVLCTAGGRTVRYPVATDPDLDWLRSALLEHGDKVDQPTSAHLLAEVYESGCSVDRAWRQLGRLACRLDAPGYAQSLIANRHGLVASKDAGVRRLAGFLLYLMTVDRNSVLSRPVLGAFRTDDEHEILLEQIETAWQEGDRLLAPFAESAVKRKLHTAFT